MNKTQFFFELIMGIDKFLPEGRQGLPAPEFPGE